MAIFQDVDILLARVFLCASVSFWLYGGTQLGGGGQVALDKSTPTLCSFRYLDSFKEFLPFPFQFVGSQYQAEVLVNQQVTCWSTPGLLELASRLQNECTPPCQHIHPDPQ